MSKPLRGILRKTKLLKRDAVASRSFVWTQINCSSLARSKADHFELGAYVDVTATSKGKGFRGDEAS